MNKAIVRQLNSARTARKPEAHSSALVPALLALPLLVALPEMALAQSAATPGLSAAGKASGAGTSAAETTPGTTFFEILHGNGTGSGYVLSHGNVIADSVRIYLGGDALQANRDYWLDEASGTLYFASSLSIFRGVSVSYRYRTDSVARKTLAPGLQFSLNQNTQFGLLFGQSSGNGSGFDTALHGLNFNSKFGANNASNVNGLLYFSNISRNANTVLTLPASLDAPAPTKMETGQDHLIAQSLQIHTGTTHLMADFQDVGEKFGGFQALKQGFSGNQAALDQLKQLEAQKGMKGSTLGLGFDFGNKKLSGGMLPGLNFETRKFADKEGGLLREQITLNTGSAQFAFLTRRMDATFGRAKDLSDADKTQFALDIQRQFEPDATADKITAGDRDRLTKETGLERQALRGSFALGKASAITFNQFSLADTTTLKSEDPTSANGDRSLARQSFGFHSKTLQFSLWKQNIADNFTRLCDLSDIEKKNFGSEHGLAHEQMDLLWQFNKTTKLTFSRLNIAGTTDAIQNAIAGAQKANKAQSDIDAAAKTARAGLQSQSLGLELKGLKLALNQADTDKEFARSADVALPDADKHTIETERGFQRSDQSLHFDALRGLVVDRFQLKANNVQDKLAREAEKNSIAYSPFKTLLLTYADDRDETASDSKANGTLHQLLSLNQKVGKTGVLKLAQEQNTTLDTGNKKDDTRHNTVHFEAPKTTLLGLNFDLDNKQVAYLDGKYEHTMNFNVHVKPVQTLDIAYTHNTLQRSWDPARDVQSATAASNANQTGNAAVQVPDSLDPMPAVQSSTHGLDLQWQAAKKFSVVLGTSQTDTNNENNADSFTAGLVGEPAQNLQLTAKFNELHDDGKNVKDVADVSIGNAKPLCFGPLQEITFKAGYASLNDKKRLQNETMTGHATWKLWKNQFTLDYGSQAKDNAGKTTDVTISRLYAFTTDPNPSRLFHGGFVYKVRTLVDGQEKLIRRFTADARLTRNTRFTYLFGTLPEDDAGNIQPRTTAEVGLTHQFRPSLAAKFFYHMNNDDATKILTRGLGFGIEGNLGQRSKLTLNYSKDTNGFADHYDRQDRLRFAYNQQLTSENFFSLSTELRTHDQANVQNEIRSNLDVNIKF